MDGGTMLIEYGVIFNNDGEQVEKVKISANKKTFDSDDRAYMVYRGDTKNFIHLKRRYLWFVVNYKYYLYNIDNPEPIKLTTNYIPKMNAEQFNILMKTKVLKDLNNVGGMFDKVNIKMILLGLVVVGVIIYLLQGGKIV